MMRIHMVNRNIGRCPRHPPPRRCGSHIVLAVPLALKNCGTSPFSKDWSPSAGLIDLGNDSLLTGTASKKLRASINPAARPFSEMTVNQTRLTMLTLYGVNPHQTSSLAGSGKSRVRQGQSLPSDSILRQCKCLWGRDPRLERLCR